MPFRPPFSRHLSPVLLPLFLALASPLILPAQTPVAPRGQGAPFEWRTDVSFTGRSPIAEGTVSRGDLQHQSYRIDGVRTIALDHGAAYLVGASWRRFEFSKASFPVPESLTAMALKLGYSRPLNQQWSLRAEVDPGLYSDFEDISSDDFNAPVGLRMVYAASRELQWLFGLNVDLRSSNPVIGGFGVRWQFAPNWTLLFLIPEPRIEYAVSPTVRIFGGASLRGGTFRVAENYGRTRGRPELDNQDIDFREISTGVGVRWQLQPGLTLTASGGWTIDRRFEFEKRNLLLNGDGAPTFQLALNGSF
jgi:hypothetical protein